MAVCTLNSSFLGFHQKSHQPPQQPPQQLVFLSGKRWGSSKRERHSSLSNTACVITCSAGGQQTVVIGLAADSGCGKSTFMRRLTSVFGGAAEPPKGGNPDSNTLISDTTTVICLDDYHSLDRTGRKEKGVTALDPKANDFDLMYEQVKALKNGVPVDKPIYNHVSGLLDPPELIKPPKILVIEGLHPMYDSRVRDLLDFSIYLDISNEVKFAWKIQRDMAERGHSLESIKASIEARKPDFDAYIDPQKQYADAVIEVLPTNLIPDDNEGKVLRVRLIMMIISNRCRRTKKTTTYVYRDDLNKKKQSPSSQQQPEIKKVKKRVRFAETEPVIIAIDAEEETEKKRVVRITVKVTKQEANRMLSRCSEGGVLELGDAACELMRIPAARVRSSMVAN